MTTAQAQARTYTRIVDVSKRKHICPKDKKCSASLKQWERPESVVGVVQMKPHDVLERDCVVKHFRSLDYPRSCTCKMTHTMMSGWMNEWLGRYVGECSLLDAGLDFLHPQSKTLSITTTCVARHRDSCLLEHLKCGSVKEGDECGTRMHATLHPLS